MENRYNRGNMRSDEYRRERKRSVRAIALAILFALGAIGIFIYIYVSKTTTYTGYEEEIICDDLGEAITLPAENGFIRYDRDGAEGYNNNASLVWQIAYAHRDPIAATCGEYSVFAGRGEQTANITNGTGANYELVLPEPIVSVGISSGGITAVLTDAGTRDHIYLYDLSLTRLLDIETTVRKDGFPIAMAFSPDGKRLVTSYLKVGEEQENRLTFYNFGDVGQNYSNRVVGSFSYGSSLIPEIRFLTNDRFCAVTADGCDIYRFSEVPEEPKHISYSDGIKSIANSSSYLVLTSGNTSEGYKIDILTVNGDKVSSTTTNTDYDAVYVSGEEVMLTVGPSCTVYKVSGEEKITMRLSDTIRYIMNRSDPALYIAVGARQTAQIRLKTEASQIK